MDNQQPFLYTNEVYCDIIKLYIVDGGKVMIKLNTVKGYEHMSNIYWVTKDGEVLSERLAMKPIKKRQTKPTPKSKNKYYEVCVMSNDGKKNYIKIHRLIAKAFVPNPENKPQVNHIDQNGLNNNVGNLEWCTAKENSRYTNAKKVYCYDINGLKKVYEAAKDSVEDGFNLGHVANCCRGDIPKGRKYPVVRHKNHVFSYKELPIEEVVQRLSKPRNFKPDGWSAWK